MAAKNSQIYKRTYYLPAPLVDFFANWCKPGRDYTTKVAGAILYFMSLDPTTRRTCEELAFELEQADEFRKAIDDLAAQKAASDRDNLLPLPDLLRQIQLHAQIPSESRKAKKKTKRRSQP